MALVTCPECKQQVPDHYTSCPGCRADLNPGKPSGDGVQLTCFHCRKVFLVDANSTDGPAHCPGCLRRVTGEQEPTEQGQPSSPRPPVHRPIWVYLVVFVYVLLMATLTFGPFVIALIAGDTGTDTLFALLATTVLALSGLSLVIVPLRGAWTLPAKQRLIWLPIIGSATLAMVLFGGFAMAAHEFAFEHTGVRGGEVAGYALLIALPVVWLGWVIVFGLMSTRVASERLANWLGRTLFTGSVLELLVAIPMHLVVRQRGYCCAGIGTGIGIGIGLLVMLIAFGPAIVFLFYRRYQQAYARRPGKRE